MRAEFEHAWGCWSNHEGRPCTPTEYRRIVRKMLRPEPKNLWAARQCRLVFDSVMNQYWLRVLHSYAHSSEAVYDIMLESEKYE